jgi:HlyD family secretion protein
VRIGALMPGRVVEVLVGVNDKVGPGDLLVRLEDDELLARVYSANAEAALRKRDRDNTDAGGKPAQDRRAAEDALANAERQLYQSREELDRVAKQRRDGSSSDADVDKARDAVAKAKERIDQARVNLRKALSADNLPAPTRPEVALTAARSDLSMAEAALEKARVRAPSAGTVLQVNVRAGESVAPSAEHALLSIGNLSQLRVRAEFEERDIGKVRVGQAVVVRSDAFGSKDFEGKIISLGQSLGPSKLGQRGPRKPTDVDVLEAVIELAGQPGLLPGMRVDVFVRPDGQPAPAAGAPKRAAAAN